MKAMAKPDLGHCSEDERLSDGDGVGKRFPRARCCFHEQIMLEVIKGEL